MPSRQALNYTKWYADMEYATSGADIKPHFSILARGTYHGYRFAILNINGSHPAVYVRVRPHHQFYGKPAEAIDLNVHGGVTFVSDKIPASFSKDSWWIGWDYAHDGDQVGWIFDGKKYNVKELVADAKKAVEQLEV